MKKNKLFGLALLVSMASFTACSNDTEDLLIQENEIKLTSEIVPTTRVASLEYQSTQIVKGQLVGVTIIGAKGEHNNVAWEAGTNGALTNTGENIYYSGNAEAKITAYHPYNTVWKGTSHTFSINTDQSTNEGYLASDLLWASKTVTKTEETVALTFTHKLAKINITLVPENDTEEDKAKLNNAIISICNTKTSTTIDLSNGNIPENAIGNVQEIKAGVGSTASAIVIPQTITGNTKFIKIEHSGKTFYYTLGDTGKKIKSGYSHNYTLTVKEQTVEIKTESDEITDWKDDDNIGDAEEEVSTIPNNEIWYTTTNGEVIDISNSSTFNTDIESNTYNNGKGVIKFNSDVTTINKGEFSVSATLASVVLPKSVTKIGQEAFSGSESLERITISNSVKAIEARAFTGCASLTSITIPNSVNTIGDQAFFGCSSLTTIIVDKDNQVYDSRNNCNAIIETESNKLIAGCNTTIIPNNVEIIGHDAFGGPNSLTAIEIPNSVTEIEFYAFSGCTSLKSITIPSSVTKIGLNPFPNCTSLKSIIVEQSNPIYDSRDNCNAIIEKASNTLIAGCSNTTIPNSVTSIGEYAFAFGSSLMDIVIPNSVTEIGECAFMHCTSLNNIIIPENVTSIGQEAFYGCSSLSKVDIKAIIPPTLGSNAFYNCDNELIIYVPSESLEIYQSDDYWNSFSLFTETIPTNEIWYTTNDNNTVNLHIYGYGANIISNVYKNGKGIVTFDNDVSRIAAYAFQDCTSLTNITIPEKVISLCSYAFDNCKSLKNITIPKSVTTIEYSCFNDCSSLTNIKIPNSVIKIEHSTFHNCSSLTDIFIPKSVTTIDNAAFSSCSSLTNIIVEQGNPIYDSRDNCNAIIETASNSLISGCKNSRIPNDITTIKHAAFAECKLLPNIVIPNSVTTIEHSAFYGCCSLKNIAIPLSVTSIGEEAFHSCQTLSEIYMLTTEPPTLGNKAFYDIDLNAKIFVPVGCKNSYIDKQNWVSLASIIEEKDFN